MTRNRDFDLRLVCQASRVALSLAKLRRCTSPPMETKVSLRATGTSTADTIGSLLVAFRHRQHNETAPNNVTTGQGKSRQKNARTMRNCLGRCRRRSLAPAPCIHGAHGNERCLRTAVDFRRRFVSSSERSIVARCRHGRECELSSRYRPRVTLRLVNNAPRKKQRQPFCDARFGARSSPLGGVSCAQALFCSARRWGDRRALSRLLHVGAQHR